MNIEIIVKLYLYSRNMLVRKIILAPKTEQFYPARGQTPCLTLFSPMQCSALAPPTQGGFVWDLWLIVWATSHPPPPPGDITILPHFALPYVLLCTWDAFFGPPTTHSGSCAYVRAGEKVGLGFLRRAQQIGAGIPNH